MENSDEKICDLCYNKIVNENFKEIGDVTKEILSVLLSKQNIDISKKNVMCFDCVEDLKISFDFKTVCLYTEDFLFPFTKAGRDVTLDIKEIFVEKQKNKHAKIPKGKKVCRLCMELILNDNYVLLHGTQKDVTMLIKLQKIIPELNLNIIREPVICIPCLSNLTYSSDFLDKCSNVQNDVAGCYIKNETVIIKTETEDNPVDYCKSLEELASFPSMKQKYTVSDEKDYKGHQKLIKSKAKKRAKIEEVRKFPCGLCTYIAKRKYHLREHLLSHQKEKKKRVVPTCPVCGYEARTNYMIQTHMIVHTDPSEIKLYSCKFCPHQSRYKASMMSHMAKHSTNVYTCGYCNMETKYREVLQRHIKNLHKDSSKMEMYRCANCQFQSKTKDRLRRHILRTHMDPSKIFKYECHLCPYKNADKGLYNTHMVLHKDSSEVTIYKCELCPYETRYKKALGVHSRVHKHESERKIFMCLHCTFKCKDRSYFKRHLLIHEDPSKLEVFHCYLCSHSTTYKSNLTKHLQRHRDEVI